MKCRVVRPACIAGASPRLSTVCSWHGDSTADPWPRVAWMLTPIGVQLRLEVEALKKATMRGLRSSASPRTERTIQARRSSGAPEQDSRRKHEAFWKQNRAACSRDNVGVGVRSAQRKRARDRPSPDVWNLTTVPTAVSDPPGMWNQMRIKSRVQSRGCGRFRIQNFSP